MSNKFVVLLFLKVDCINPVNAWASMLCVSIFPIIVFLSRPEHREWYRVSWWGRSCTSTELQPFLWKLKVWSSGEGSSKFPIRQEDGSKITAQSQPQGDLPFGSLCVQRTQDQVSLLMCFTFLGESLPGALALLWPHYFLQGPNQEIFILWVLYLQILTSQFCNCKQSWITV